MSALSKLKPKSAPAKASSGTVAIASKAKPKTPKPKPPKPSIRETFSSLDDSAWLSEKEAAELIDFRVLSLKRWRTAGTGPPAVYIGNRIRYSVGGFRRWQASQSAKPPPPPRPTPQPK